MKKNLLTVACFALSATASIAETLPQKPKPKVSTFAMGRECCTKTAEWGQGSTITVTACSGWFLSNSETSYAKACEKAELALAAAL